MKIKSLLVICLCIQPYLLSQTNVTDTTEISLSMLLPPASPGFVLLGKEPAAVERPGSVTDFAVNVLNRTNNLSLLPKDYAFEVAPFWLAGMHDLSYEEYKQDGSIWENIRQSLSISLATSTDDITSDSSITSMGFGLRMSLIRGDIDPGFNNYKLKMDSVLAAMKVMNTEISNKISEEKENNPEIKNLIKMLNDTPDSQKPVVVPVIQAQLAAINSAIDEKVKKEVREKYKNILTDIRNTVNTMQFRRVGWKMDFATGFAVRFPDQVFSQSKAGKWGAWLTGGYDDGNISFLGVGRFLADPDNSVNNSFDVGGRLIFDNGKLFSASLEYVLRTLPNTENNASNWRLAMIAEYYIGENKALSITFGRDFDGTKNGSLISALNLLLGFGSIRPF